MMINIAVIGYGYWGPNLARCVAESEDCSLSAVVDASPAALARAGKRHPSARLFADWNDALADPTIDAVMIATPVDTHYDMGLAALNAGKHVFVEKPMTSDSRQAATLIELAAKRNRVLMVDHTFVYTPAVQKIRDLITDGSIGKVYYYHSTRINLGLFQRDVNVIWDLAVHDLAILDFIMDTNPLAVSASGIGHIQGVPENMAHIALFYPDGFVAHLNVNWLAPVKVRQTLIAGSRRMIVYDDLEPSEKVKVYDRGVNLSEAGTEEVNKLRVSYRQGDMWAPHLSVKEALLTEVEHFTSCIDQSGVPTTSGANGMRVVEMLECAVQSLNQRGAPIEINPMRRAS